jgi:hypothetical protein
VQGLNPRRRSDGRYASNYKQQLPNSNLLIALSLVRYAPGSTSATRIAEITFVATGSNTAGPELAFTKLENDSELQGNTAVARILVDPSRDASGLL